MCAAGTEHLGLLAPWHLSVGPVARWAAARSGLVGHTDEMQAAPGGLMTATAVDGGKNMDRRPPGLAEAIHVPAGGVDARQAS